MVVIFINLIVCRAYFKPDFKSYIVRIKICKINVSRVLWKVITLINMHHDGIFFSKNIQLSNFFFISKRSIKLKILRFNSNQICLNNLCTAIILYVGASRHINLFNHSLLSSKLSKVVRIYSMMLDSLFNEFIKREQTQFKNTTDKSERTEPIWYFPQHIRLKQHLTAMNNCWGPSFA